MAERRRTPLTPEQERAFQAWYQQWARTAGINPNPDDPQQLYDYRGAYAAGVAPSIDPSDQRYHWPSRFKDWAHPNRYVEGVDTITGQRVNDRALADVLRRRYEGPLAPYRGPGTDPRSLADILRRP